ncbi:MAG: HIT family protein [Candidatus Absconditabacteria bacterium]|nr:HIT family protein [Candidatus Absconditabacteria bacterium]
MQYGEILAHLNKDHICPFCQETHPHMIHENKHMYIIPARAPYVDDHLLIIPKRHVILLQELNHSELIALHELVDTWTNKLHTKHEAVNLLLRDGLAEKKSQKSINHLHFHLIPDCPIGAEERSGSSREFLDDQTYITITQTIKEIYN